MNTSININSQFTSTKSHVNLGIIAAMYANQHNGNTYVHLSLGRVIDRLADKYDKIYLCVPVSSSASDNSRDYQLKAKNIEIIPQPFYRGSLDGLRHFPGIISAYWKTCRASDRMFIRGMIPFVFFVYLFAKSCKTSTCHWIVGNPVALLKSHKRGSKTADILSMAYALQDRYFTKTGRRLTKGSFICNGQELADIYKSPNTITTVSSTITAEEIYERKDTCQGKIKQLLFVGFIRPEKGVEYLIEACGKLKDAFDWKLTLIGTFGKYQNYKNKIEALIKKYDIADRIEMPGYISYGEEMFAYFRKSDIFILPTLSEGTPRVLVEARANSLPVISTTVGGVPTSVSDGVDGLLVRPQDSDALAKAIETLVRDTDLRQSIIANGLQTARKTTVNHFADSVWKTIEQSNDKSN